MKRAVEDGRAIVVYANGITWRDYLIGRKELLDHFDGHESFLLEDGMVILGNPQVP
jgi:hypothetical protein